MYVAPPAEMSAAGDSNPPSQADAPQARVAVARSRDCYNRISKQWLDLANKDNTMDAVIDSCIDDRKVINQCQPTDPVQLEAMKTTIDRLIKIIDLQPPGCIPQFVAAVLNRLDDTSLFLVDQFHPCKGWGVAMTLFCLDHWNRDKHPDQSNLVFDVVLLWLRCKLPILLPQEVHHRACGFRRCY